MRAMPYGISTHKNWLRCGPIRQPGVSPRKIVAGDTFPSVALDGTEKALRSAAAAAISGLSSNARNGTSRTSARQYTSAMSDAAAALAKAGGGTMRVAFESTPASSKAKAACGLLSLAEQPGTCGIRSKAAG